MLVLAAISELGPSGRPSIPGRVKESLEQHLHQGYNLLIHYWQHFVFLFWTMLDSVLSTIVFLWPVHPILLFPASVCHSSSFPTRCWSYSPPLGSSSLFFLTLLISLAFSFFSFVSSFSLLRTKDFEFSFFLKNFILL